MTVDLLGDRAVYDTSRFPPPREFQRTAHELLRQGARNGGHRYQMLCSPTGSGKTYLALRACSESLAKGRRALFLCDRLALIDQASETADRYGLSAHGIIQGDHWRTDVDMPFQIASAQTLDKRGWPYSPPDLIIIDEAHTQYATWLKYLADFKGHVIGLSATPFSAGLGKVFSNLVNAATMARLIDEGVLVPLRVLSCIRPNMAGAKTAEGEWTRKEAEQRGMALVGDIVSEWRAHAEGRKTICFGATIAHCEAIARQFNEAGIMTAVFCSETTPVARQEILRDFRPINGLVKVLVSVDALAKGFDVPDVGCIIDARPLRKGFSTFVQIIGRGLRSSPETGKKDCLLLDHSGNILRFAADFEEFYFNGIDSLDSGERLDKDIRKDPEEAEVRSCPKCGYSPFMRRCLSCGFQIARVSKIVHERSAGMREIVIGKVRYDDRRQNLYEQVVTHCLEVGNPETAKGRAAHLYREATGTWPNLFSFERAAEKRTPVSAEVSRYSKSSFIRFIKGKAKR